MYSNSQKQEKIKKYLQKNIKLGEGFFYLEKNDFLNINEIIYNKNIREINKIIYRKNDTDAITLYPDVLQADTGWVITGEIKEEYYKWINDFHATKNEHYVHGNMESILKGSSKEAIIEFILEHLYYIRVWDYKDI